MQDTTIRIIGKAIVPCPFCGSGWEAKSVNGVTMLKCENPGCKALFPLEFFKDNIESI